MKTKHKPVLLSELIESLSIQDGQTIVDATLGGGGHLKKVLNQSTNIKIIAFDVDEHAISRFSQYLKTEGFEQENNEFKKAEKTVILIKSNFKNIAEELKSIQIEEIDVIYADLGFSTDQLEDNLSFERNGLLDLRMDNNLTVTAADLLNALYKKELESIFINYGNIENANKLANAVIKFRNKRLFQNKADLNQVIAEVLKSEDSKLRSENYEARVFQALRIAVNDEINNLSKFLKDGFKLLRKNGRFGVISFHSGEDREVKKFFKSKIKNNEAEWIEELLTPTQKEIQQNIQSRSAKLRVIKKL